MAKRFASILETIGRTPVVRINRLAPPGVNLFVKCESFNPLSSVKDRLAFAVIEAAERSGELKPGQTVVEATSGNTGIGLAMVCAAKGYPLVLLQAEPFSVERRRLMRFLGAKVVITPAAERAVGMINKMEELATKHGWFMTRQIQGPEAIQASKALAAKEGIFCGITSGGAFAGALRIAAEAPQGANILAMLPDTAERYLSTPLFADIGADMNEEELVISRSTPGGQLKT